MHLHSTYSADGTMNVNEIIMFARKIGLNGIAITDHNEVKGALKGIEIARGIENFVVIPGIEVSSSEGHIIALGLEERVERNLPITETVEIIRDLNGTVIAPHLCRLISGIGVACARKIEIQGIEVINARSVTFANEKARRLAKEMGVTETGGSDAHFQNEIGRAFTAFEFESYDADELLQEIEKGNVKAFGQSASMHDAIKQSLKNGLRWIKSGMRRV